MPYLIKAKFAGGEDRSRTYDLSDARARADTLLVGHLREHSWCAVTVADDDGSIVYTRVEGAAPDA